MEVGLPLMKNVFTLLAKSVLIPLGLTAAVSAVDAGIHKKSLSVWNNNIRRLCSIDKRRYSNN